jgi:hypothetical protein
MEIPDTSKYWKLLLNDSKVQTCNKKVEDGGGTLSTEVGIPVRMNCVWTEIYQLLVVVLNRTSKCEACIEYRWALGLPAVTPKITEVSTSEHYESLT